MRIGSISWVRRGTYLENARLLEPHVDFVELLVYTWDEGTKTLLEKELDDLRSLDLFYTVHLPLDTIANCRAAYSFFKKHSFPVANHTLHPLRGWRTFIEGKKDVTLENLKELQPPCARMTIDIGHLMLAGREEALLRNPALKRIREFHLHGVSGGTDHRILDERTVRYLRNLADRYPLFRRALMSPDTLFDFEVFDYRRLIKSIGRFTDAFPRSPVA